MTHAADAPPPGWTDALVACVARLARLSNSLLPAEVEIGIFASALWERHQALRPCRGWEVLEEPRELDALGVAAEQAHLREAVARRGGTVPELLEPHLRHLVRIVAQPEFTRCRNSFRVSGGCIPARQRSEVCSRRLSGAHCVDCPHFVYLSTEENRALLLEAWYPEGRDALRDAWDVFLPEDFRRLRQLLHESRRASKA